MLGPALALALALQAAAVAPSAPSPLAGDWVVDLTPSPTAKPYLKGMTLAPAADGTVTGQFYDSEIQAGRWKAQGGRTCASFRTSDGEGPYHTAVCLTPGGAQGQTWAEQRAFVFVWSARRATTADKAQPWS